MTDVRVRAGKRTEMHVRVKRAGGTVEAPVPEAALEKHGWGLDPLGAVEAFRAERNREAEQDGREPWDDTHITVVSDTDAGHPTLTYRLQADLLLEATRDQQALRTIGQYLLDLANGLDPASPGFSGRLDLAIVELKGTDHA
jgi:hypothetical protein